MVDFSAFIEPNARSQAARLAARRSEQNAVRSASAAAQTQGAVNPTAAARLVAQTQSDQRAANAGGVAAAEAGDKLAQAQAISGVINAVGEGVSTAIPAVGMGSQIAGTAAGALTQAQAPAQPVQGATPPQAPSFGSQAAQMVAAPQQGLASQLSNPVAPQPQAMPQGQERAFGILTPPGDPQQAQPPAQAPQPPSGLSNSFMQQLVEQPPSGLSNSFMASQTQGPAQPQASGLSNSFMQQLVEQPPAQTPQAQASQIPTPGTIQNHQAQLQSPTPFAGPHFDGQAFGRAFAPETVDSNAMSPDARNLVTPVLPQMRQGLDPDAAVSNLQQLPAPQMPPQALPAPAAPAPASAVERLLGASEARQSGLPQKGNGGGPKPTPSGSTMSVDGNGHRFDLSIERTQIPGRENGPPPRLPPPLPRTLEPAVEEDELQISRLMRLRQMGFA